MSFAAIIPVANMAAANTTLEEAGFGPLNFSVPAYGATGATHAALHAWDDAVFVAAVKAIPNVAWREVPFTVGQATYSDPVSATRQLITEQGAQWGAQAPALPTSGNAIAGTLYRFTDNTLWWCIQTFSRTAFPAIPSTYPALIRQLRVPGSVEAWKQPIDASDAYQLVNPFTGQPDKATHAGKTWVVSQADGSGNNVWQPGVFGWTVQA